MNAIDTLLHYRIISYFFTYVLIGIPIFMGIGIIHNSKKIYDYLGFNESIIQGFLFSFLFTLPMYLGGIIFFPLNREITVTELIKITVFAGLFEELYFRGFLFGQLYRYTRIGFIPAIFFGALLFGGGHLYQSHELSTSLGIFITTFMGAVFFAWLYVEWNYNLWLIIFIHFFMNLSWAIFVVSDNALGGYVSNIFRGLTIAVAIIATIIYKRRTGKSLEINKRTLLWK